MATKNKPQIRVVMKEEQPVTTSKNVAENFDKNHQHVLRDIRNLLKEDVSSFGQMFKEGSEPDSYGRHQKVYYMNRDGFTLLAMGFTGKKALEFKLAYIEQFNRMEQRLHKQLPGTYKEALLQLIEKEEEKERLLLENSKLKPKADYYDSILKNKGLVTISTIAKNYGFSARTFNNVLHELKIQYKQSGTWLLYQKYSNEGYAHIEPHVYTNKEGKLKTTTTMKWTQKGHKFLYDKLKENGYLPLIEQED
jgi:Rha family phage regulatory protein